MLRQSRELGPKAFFPLGPKTTLLLNLTAAFLLKSSNIRLYRHRSNLIQIVNVGFSLSSQKKPDKELDCLGLYCPEPVFRTRLEIDKLAVGQVLEVIADDPAAEEDIKLLVNRLGHQLLEIRKDEDRFHFFIKKVK